MAGFRIDINDGRNKPVEPLQPPGGSVAPVVASAQASSEVNTAQTIGDVVTGGVQDGVTLSYDVANRVIDATNTDKGTVAVTAHLAATDPHGDRAYADDLLADHLVEADPHTQYVHATGGDVVEGTVEITESDPGALVIPLIVSNPVAATVDTTVGIALCPNDGGVDRAAQIRSRQSNSGQYATLDFYIVNNSVPGRAFGVNRFGEVDFAQQLLVSSLATSGGLSNGGRVIISRGDTAHEAWTEYQHSGVRYWYHGFTADAAADFVLRRYNNSGTLQNVPLRVDRATGDIITLPTASPPTLANNGEMVFNLTSNTNLRISVRGSDGTTRTADITLA